MSSSVQDYYFDNFIGVFETNLETQSFIDFFKYCDKTKPAWIYRNDIDKAVDTAIPLNFHTSSYFLDIDNTASYTLEHNQIMGQCLDLYTAKYSVLKTGILQTLHISVQRVLPGEGYHKWHFEHSGELKNNRRMLATLLYLNDDFEGGELEFIYLHKRIKPKKGLVIMFPSGFTHTHRGNPPLTGEKYVAASWLENVSN